MSSNADNSSSRGSSPQASNEQVLQDQASNERSPNEQVSYHDTDAIDDAADNDADGEAGSKLDTGHRRVDSFLIVGIGVSAGGLEAFQTCFRQMDENSGMAFVLVSHLAPDHDSLLLELLAKETQMSVLQVQEETRLKPNKVYVIPLQSRCCCLRK